MPKVGKEAKSVSKILTILAVTKMTGNHVCVGGIDKDGNWVRPVTLGTNGGERLSVSDISLEGGVGLSVFGVVKIEFLSHLNNSPHSEDWIMSPDSLQVVSRLPEERGETFLKQHAEGENFIDKDFTEELVRRNRSLVLLGQVELKSVEFNENKKHRLNFSIPGETIERERSLPVTCLRFRALGKRLLEKRKREHLDMTSDEFIAEFGIDRVYISIGLTRLWKGTYWPMIIGLYTFPDYEVEIDYTDL